MPKRTRSSYGLTQNEQLDELNTYSPVIIQKAVTADGTGGLTVAYPGFDYRIVDVIVEGRAASSGGTVKLVNGSTDITDAIVMAADKAITRAGTIDDAQSSITSATTLKVTAGQAGDRGLVQIIGVRT